MLRFTRRARSTRSSTVTEPKRHELGGRVYVPIGESTVEHDLALREAVCRAGLDHLELAEAEAPEEYARRLLRHVVAGGQVLPLIGLLLIPEGLPSEQWTPEIAAETISWIKGLPAREALPLIDSMVVGLLIGFFESGLASLRCIATSSSPLPGGGDESDANNSQAGMENGPA